MEIIAVARGVVLLVCGVAGSLFAAMQMLSYLGGEGK